MCNKRFRVIDYDWFVKSQAIIMKCFTEITANQGEDLVYIYFVLQLKHSNMTSYQKTIYFIRYDKHRKKADLSFSLDENLCALH